MRIVQRPRLSARVAALAPRLVLLIAPAGFGKSSLMQEIVGNFERSEIVDCALADDVAALARRISLALAGLADRTEQVAREQVATIADAQEAVLLTERLWADLDCQGVIVFENTEIALQDNDRADLLRRLVRAPGTHRTIIVCSRVRLPAGFSGRLGPQEIVVVSEDELRFTKDEIDLLLDDVALSDRQLHRLYEVSRGWAIALRLFEHVAYDRDVDAAISALGNLDTETLQAYVVEQVIPSLDPDAYEALLACSAIPGASHLDLMTYFGARSDMIFAALKDAARTPFVAAGVDGAFDPHPLVRAALQAREASAMRDILLATANAYREAGNGIRAAQLFLYGGDQLAAARALGPVEAFLVDVVPPAVGAILSAFDKSTLVAFPSLWQAAINYRALRISPQEWLNEARHAWASLTDDDSVPTWCGVAMNLGNCYHNLGQHEQEAALLELIERRFANDAFATMTLKLARFWCDMYRARIDDFQPRMDELAPVLAIPYVKAMLQYDALAPFERFAIGDLVADQQLLVQAIESARGFETRVLLVLALVEAAFAAWFAGDEALFDRFCGEVREATDSSVEGGTRHFLDSIAGHGTAARFGSEKLNARAYVQLIAAGRATSAIEARRLAAAAVATADEAQVPAYQILARIALTVLDFDSDGRRLAEALDILLTARLPALRDATTAFARSEPELGILKAFVHRFQLIANKTDTIEVRLLESAVRRGGVDIALHERSRELLLQLASERRAFSTSELIDALWAESDADHAMNALRVAVNRLRRNLGSTTIVSTPGGYRLASDVTVDVFELSEMLRLYTAGADLDAQSRLRLTAAFDASSPSRIAHLAVSPIRAPLRREIANIHYRAGMLLARDAIERKDFPTATDIASELVNALPFDEPARRIHVESLLGFSGEEAARSEWSAYEAACRTRPRLPRPLAFGEIVALMGTPINSN